MRRTDIGIADVARAVAALDPKVEEFDRIVALLGFRRTKGGNSGSRQSAAQGRPVSPREISLARPGPSKPVGPMLGAALASELIPLGVKPPLVPWAELSPLQAPATRYTASLDPLFDPKGARALLSALVAAKRPIGEVDVESLREKIASGLAIRTLPRELRRTLVGGAELLIDKGPSMLPYARDSRDLAALLRRTAGERLMVMSFDGTPQNGVMNSFVACRYEPSNGATVLIVSNFGIGPRAPEASTLTPADWVPFLDKLAAARCSVLGLVPGRSVLLPRMLRDRIAVIPWERSTTTRSVQVERRRVEPPERRNG